MNGIHAHEVKNFLIEALASMGHSSICKLICAISVCNILTVGVHLSSIPSMRSPGPEVLDPPQ